VKPISQDSQSGKWRPLASALSKPGVSLLCSLLFAASGHAAEGIRLPGPIGGADIGGAFLPPPGIYGATGLTVPQNTRFYGPNGSVSAQGTSFGFAGALLAVYPFEVFGGRVGSMVLDSYADVNATVPGVLPQSQDSGIGDVYFEPLFWSRLFSFGGPSEAPGAGGPPPIPFGLAVGATMGVTFPNGHYKVEQPVNVGLNHYVLSPSLALTYTFPSLIPFGDAMELSGRFYYNIQFKNPADNYLSGNLYNVDFAATIRNGPYQFGLAGSYVDQITDDKINGNVVGNGNRAMVLQLGPVVNMNFMVNGRPWQVGFKALFDVKGRNTLGNNIFTVRLATKFY
jgi:hypothetical protein